MKIRFTAAISACSLLLIVCAVFSKAYADPFRVGYFVLKPHAMEGHKGTAVEYFKYIAEEMGISDITFQQMPLKRSLTELEKERIDAVLLLAKNPERETKFVYPQMPFIRTEPVIAVKKTHYLKSVGSVDDLLSLRFSKVAKGYLSPMMRDPRLNFEPIHGSDTLSRGIEKVLSGYCDAYYIPDAYSMRFVVMSGGYEAEIRIMAIPDPPFGLYTVFSKKSAEKYLHSYEKALEEVEDEEPYDVFFNRMMKNYQ